MKNGAATAERRWRGIAAAPGVALGPAYVYRAGAEEPPLRLLAPGTDVQIECRRLDEALAAVREDLLALRQAAPGSVGSAIAKIFDAQVLIVDDETIRAQVRQAIAERQLSAESAFAGVVGEAQKAIAHAADPYLREMANDIGVVKRRVINRLLGLAETQDQPLAEPAVVFARTITPADIIGLKKELVLGIVSQTGGQTSHTALLAKSLGIPAVVGVGFDVRVVRTGAPAVIDGFSGTVIVAPRDGTIEFFERKKKRAHRPWPKRLDALREEPAVTSDSHSVLLMANIDLAGEAGLAAMAGASGVGLYRTEYLFLQHGSYPSESRQRAVYREAVDLLQGKPLVVRTFDLGYDKAVPHSAPETNPALGVRGVRLSLVHPAPLLNQFRALLAVSARGPIWVMVPMVASVEEFRAVRRLWEEAKSALSERNIPYDPKTRLGLMIETPAAVRMAPELARLARFFSIGSNDLVQYTAAVDRGNARLARLSHYWHPALWRQVADVIGAGHRARIPVAVCGEMAGDLLAVAPLLGLGIDSLSFHPNSIPRVKALVRMISFARARRLAVRMLHAATADEVRALVKDFHERVVSRPRKRGSHD